jgi:ATP adenylyltransferase
MSQDRPLWAPWRIAFIRGKKDKHCFMCGQKSPAETTPEEELIVHRGEHAFVILNRFPYNSGHLLVAPYRHIGDISELTAAERVEVMDLCVKSKEVLDKVMKPAGFNVGFNLGVAAGAGIADHIHLHIVPRWNGDCNFMPAIGDVRVVPEALVDTAALIRAAWT